MEMTSLWIPSWKVPALPHRPRERVLKMTLAKPVYECISPRSNFSITNLLITNTRYNELIFRSRFSGTLFSFVKIYKWYNESSPIPYNEWFSGPVNCFQIGNYLFIKNGRPPSLILKTCRANVCDLGSYLRVIYLDLFFTSLRHMGT